MATPARLITLLAGAATALVVSACGDTAATETRSRDAAPAEPRAEAEAADQERKQAAQQLRQTRCANLRESVKVSYRVIADATATGQEIWLRMTVRNDTGHYVGGPFSGMLKVTAADPGQPLPMNWGGSSADEAGAEAHRTFVHRILNLNAQPLRTPADARVTDVAIDYTNLQLCQMPARVRAPRGLVTEHPSGRWFVNGQGDELSRSGG